jgi:hypothetical protein
MSHAFLHNQASLLNEIRRPAIDPETPIKSESYVSYRARDMDLVVDGDGGPGMSGAQRACAASPLFDGSMRSVRKQYSICIEW